MFKEIENLIEKNDLENALTQIRALLTKAASDEDSLLRLVDVPEIDELLQLIGKKILQDQADFDFKKPINKNLNVYITEAVYRGGGHTREIEDWIENTYKDRENILIISGFFYDSHEDQLQKLKDKNIKVLINYNAESKDRVGNIKWLQRQLYDLRPDAVFLSTTRFDIVSIAALQPELVNKLYLNLSLDHGISPGIHTAHLTKIIVKRPYLYFYIKNELGLNSLVYIPLNRPDIIGSREFIVKGNQTKITTSSCTSSVEKIEAQYTYKFTEVIPGIIKATGGKHIHIGAISEKSLQELYKNMDLLGLSRRQFVKIDFVSSLAKALIENNVDILIQTFPVFGGLVTVEAMEAGIMIINHRHLYSHLLNAMDSCYKEAFIWKGSQELYDFLSSLTKDEILKQQKLSRECYLKHHNSESLKPLMNIESFIGAEIESSANLIKEQYGYNIDYFAMSLNRSCKENSDQNHKKRGFFGRIKKSFKKRFYKFITNSFSNENRVN